MADAEKQFIRPLVARGQKEKIISTKKYSNVCIKIDCSYFKPLPRPKVSICKKIVITDRFLSKTSDN